MVTYQWVRAWCSEISYHKTSMIVVPVRGIHSSCHFREVGTGSSRRITIAVGRPIAL